MGGSEGCVFGSVIAVAGVLMLALCVLFARQFFHDLDRFGREGIPWARMLVLAEAMSVTGYGLVGTRWGLLKAWW